MAFILFLFGIGFGLLLAHLYYRRERKVEYKPEICECGHRLELMDESEVHRHKVGKAHLRALKNLRTKILVCDEIIEYRQCAREVTSPLDVVLEIGCHVGGTTQHILRNGPAVLIALDQKSELVEGAKIRLLSMCEKLNYGDLSYVLRVTSGVSRRTGSSSPNSFQTFQNYKTVEVAEPLPLSCHDVTFSEGGSPSRIAFTACDAMEFTKIQSALEQSTKDLGVSPKFTKIFVDLNGSRELSFLFSVLLFLEGSFGPELIVVKNTPLKNFCLRSCLWVKHPKYPHFERKKVNIERRRLKQDNKEREDVDEGGENQEGTQYTKVVLKHKGPNTSSVIIKAKCLE